MKSLETDFLSLLHVIAGGLPSGVKIEDISRATSLAAMFDGKVTYDFEAGFGPDPSTPIKRVSKALLEHGEGARKQMAKPPIDNTKDPRHTAQNTINFLAWEMLVHCYNKCNPPPKELLELVRNQLGVKPVEDGGTSQNMALKMDEVALYAFQNPEVTLEEIAEIFGLSYIMLHRWNATDDLRKRGQAIHRTCQDVDRRAQEIYQKINATQPKNSNSKKAEKAKKD